MPSSYAVGEHFEEFIMRQKNRLSIWRSYSDPSGIYGNDRS
jgi:hypothetical protein